MVQRKETGTAAPSSEQTNKITKYTMTSGRKVKKELMEEAEAETPTKQTRMNGTTPESMKRMKPVEVDDDEMVDGINIYDDTPPSPLPVDTHQAESTKANYDNDFPPLQSKAVKPQPNLGSTTLAATSKTTSDEPQEVHQRTSITYNQKKQNPHVSKSSAKASKVSDPQSDKTLNLPSDSTLYETKINEETQATANPEHKKVSIQETLPVIVTRKFTYRLLFSFKAKNYKKKNQTLEYKASVLRNALLGILLGGQEIAQDFAINAWRSRDKVTTLRQEKDLPTVVDQLIKYWRITSKIKPGQVNWFWGVNVTCKLDMNTFIRYWREKMPRRNQNQPTYFHPIKVPPFQSEEWFEVGWFVGSTESQYTAELEQGLSQITNGNIILEWNNVVFHGVVKFWDIARRKRKATKSEAEYKLLSPKALVVLTDEGTKRRDIMSIMYERYGRTTNSGEWPTLPDGCRMRYTPPAQNVADYAGEKGLSIRMSLQIEFKWKLFTCPTRLKDPSTLVKSENKTIGYIILSLLHNGDKIDEPYFRHFAKTGEKDNPWELVVHQHLFADASKLSDRLEDELVKKLDIEKSQYFNEQLHGMSYAATAAAQLLEFTLEDTDDMYLAGKTKFQFQGMDLVHSSHNQTATEKIKANDASVALDKESEQSPGEDKVPARSATGTG